jgi:5-methylcytosine-specific restriction protein A
LLDPEQEPIFTVDGPNNKVYERVNWTPQASGISIPDEVAEKLEIDWAKFLNRHDPVRNITYADEIDEEKTFLEGASKTVKINIYERNAEARSICIKKYGARCSICGFDFGKQFGEIGQGFIHVHHITPLSMICKGYILNPIDDLRPVCPNCHAMLHQKRPEPYTVEELKTILMQMIDKAN